jgi:hypothetical protein
MKRRSKGKTSEAVPQDKRLYTLEVFIISGPVTHKFAQQSPVISRTIEDPEGKRYVLPMALEGSFR